MLCSRIDRDAVAACHVSGPQMHATPRLQQGLRCRGRQSRQQEDECKPRLRPRGGQTRNLPIRTGGKPSAKMEAARLRNWKPGHRRLQHEYAVQISC
jgi:hypothetical protein